MTNRTRAGIVLLMLAQGLAVAACGDRKFAPPPVTGPGGLPPPPNGLALISGAVYDTAHRPLAGAAVEVLDGPQTGTSALADAAGQFSLSATLDNATRFRASKEGHVAATSTLLFPTRVGGSISIWHCQFRL